MMTALATLGAAFVGGLAFGPALCADAIEVEDAIPGDDEIVLPVGGTPEPCFEAFRPGEDTLVVVYPEAEGTPDFGALRFAHDADYDETEVRLATRAGERLVCYLPGVAPDQIGAADVEFISDRAAAALLARG